MKNSQIEIINAEISRELANEAVGRALLATTFKGLNATSMRQAIMEGMIRGFTFKDFLEKNVYAIPYGNGYSLITSIDYARKKGMRAGIVGKNAPIFEMDGGHIISCSVTVKRRVKQDIGEYTATVYFDEYTTGKNLWTSKPRTMIAKVAEMHALRMACPEELSQTYTEEEMESEAEKAAPMQSYTVERVIPAEDDEPQGKRVQPPVESSVAAETAPESKETLGVDKQDESKEIPKFDPVEERMKIAKILKDKFKFTSLGKDPEKVKDRVFDLTGILMIEENYAAIMTELIEMEYNK